MKHSMLELAIFNRNWEKVLEIWPQANIRESYIPFHLRYINEQINDKARLLIYLLDMNDESTKDQLESIVPHLPFCLMLVDKIDEQFEEDLKSYQEQFETPLFLVLPEDENLKAKITQISHMDYKLPESIVLERESDASNAIRKLINKAIEKLSRLKDMQNSPENSEKEDI